MSFFLSPIGNEQQFNANGEPLNGGKVLTYLAGSTTPTATYTDNTGATQQANPIILNSLGLPASPIWLNGGITYKFVIQDANSVTLRTVDNISGINDTTGAQTEWVSSGFVPTFISATSFSVPGDQTGILQIGRRLRTQNTAGLIYSRITNSVFAATITTVTVVNDSGALDSGLSSVAYGLAAPISPSLPNSVAVRDTMGITTALQNQEGIAYTTTGTSTAYTLTPSPAITAYAANQSFFVNFHTASGAAPTLAISGVATPPNLVKQISDGTYANVAANDIPANHRGFVTGLSATQYLVALPMAKSGANTDITSLAGTTTNDSAAAGKIGEYISSTVLFASRQALTTTTPLGLTSISLTAGDWDVSGQSGFSTDATTNVVRLVTNIGTTVALDNDRPTTGLIYAPGSVLNTPTNGTVILPIQTHRISLAATTTIYLTVSATFTVAATAAFGAISARRAR